MRKEDKDRQLAQAAKQRPPSEETVEPPPVTTNRPNLSSFHIPRVKLVRGSQQEQDILATQALVQSFTTSDGYQCPRCPYITTNLDEFLEHLEMEINKAVDHISRIGKL